MLRDFGKSSADSHAALVAFSEGVASLKLGDDDIANSVEELPFGVEGPTLDVDCGDAEFELEDEPEMAPPKPRSESQPKVKTRFELMAQAQAGAKAQEPKPSTLPDLGLQLDAAELAEPPVQAKPKAKARAKVKPAKVKPAEVKPAKVKPAEVKPVEAKAKPSLEPVGDEAHPPQNRRSPTQPHAVLQLNLDDEGGPAPTPQEVSEPVAREPAQPSPPPSAARTKPSPSPSPKINGLFSTDRLTNILAGAAVGLIITVIPAKQLAVGYEIEEVRPLLGDLEGAIEHPLGVEAGLVERPEKIAAKITAGREHTRNRYLGIWLLAGLPLGLGLGFAPRPW